MLKQDSNNDALLLSLLQKGDVNSFNAFYSKYHKAIYLNAFKITRNSAAAEDIVQDSFIKLWRKRDALQAEKSVAGWLFVTSYNASINWQKKHLQELKHREIIAAHLQEAEAVDDYEQQMSLLEKAISQLAPRQRQVFELCKLNGKTYEETGTELNISRHTVKEYLGLAMASLKKYAHTHPQYKIMVPLIYLLSNLF